MRRLVLFVLVMTVSFGHGSSVCAQLRKPGASVGGRWVAWSRKPATEWQDAFVTGNGRHGMMLLGPAGDERIICVHEELFLRAWDRHKVAVAHISDLLPRVRQLADSGKFTEAAALACGRAREQLKDMGAAQAWPVSPHPAFDLDLHIDRTGNVYGYRRQLNMETGEAATFWSDSGGTVEQTAFSSRANDVNVVRIRATNGRKLSVTLGLTETPGRSGDIDGVDVAKAFLSVDSGAVVNSEGAWLRYHAQYARDSGGYEGLARITTKGGTISATGGRHLVIKNADEILVVLRITPLEFGSTTEQWTVRTELAALPVAYSALLAPHARLHGDMFRRVALDLGCAAQWASTPTEDMLAEVHTKGVTPLFLEQMHAMGRYLLISSCGKYPPPLQGIWGGGWTPAWNGGFVFDSNVNLAISAISTGDLPECAESYFGYVERLLPAWRLNAMDYLGCHGFLVPHYSDPERGYLNHFGEGFPWMYWPSGAGWNLRPFYEHGMLTGDSVFLRDTVWPLYREMGEFYKEYLVRESDGYYHVSPGISPENSIPGQETTLAKDATVDIAVAREVFDHLMRLETMFGGDRQDIRCWKNLYDSLVPYRINADGALAEWIPAQYPDNYDHRHTSHLYPVYPGTEFLRDSTNPALLQAARVALDKRFQFDAESAHGLIHVALIAARLHEPDMVGVNLDRFCRRNYVYNGLVTSHNPNHQIYNLDAVLSLQRLLSEMVVYSQPGKIELLPAVPKGFPDGKLTGLCVYGGQKIDVSWKGGRLVSVTIHARKNAVCRLVYKDRTKQLRWVAGQTYSFDARLTPRRRSDPAF